MRTSSCTRTRRTRSSTAPPRRRSWPRRRRCTATSAVALTDHDGLWGVDGVRARVQGARDQAITGAEVTLDDGSHLTLLAANRTGYSNLCRLLTSRTRTRAPTRASALRRTPRSSRSSAMRTGSSACRAARATALPPVSGARLAPSDRAARAFGPERLASSSSARTGAATAHATAELAQLAERLQRPVRGDRQRALPPSRPRAAPRRLRGRAAAVGPSTRPSPSAAATGLR